MSINKQTNTYKLEKREGRSWEDYETKRKRKKRFTGTMKIMQKEGKERMKERHENN